MKPTFKKIADTRYLKMFDIVYGEPPRNYYMVTRNNEPFTGKVNAVHIVASTEGKIVLIKQYRPAIDEYIIDFPAGLIDKDESVEEAARRELYEETGLHLDKVYGVSPPLYNSAGLTDEMSQILMCTAVGTPNLANKEAHEEIEIMLVDWEKLDVLFDGSHKFSAKCWIYLQAFME